MKTKEQFKEIEMISELKDQIVWAYMMFEQEPEISIQEVVGLLLKNFKGHHLTSVTTAIKRGASGEFGHFHRINTHTIGVWINCHTQQCKPNDLKSKRERL